MRENGKNTGKNGYFYWKYIRTVNFISMDIAALPDNEAERLKALHSYHILDTLPEADYDAITRLASEICGVPIVLVSLIDEKRQWFKSYYGLDVSQTERDISFCSHAILKPSEPFIVTNPLLDNRFADNPLVTSFPYLSFYAGIPLVNSDGYALGTLCVIDHQPRELTKSQIEALQVLANQIVTMLELRRRIEELNRHQNEMELLNEELKSMARIIAHDIKSPISSIFSSCDLVLSNITDGDKLQFSLVESIRDSSLDILNLVDGILEHSYAFQLGYKDYVLCSLSEVIERTISLISVPSNYRIDYEANLPIIHTVPLAIEQILLNLINNSIKFSDKEMGCVKINFWEDAGFYWMSVSDNGPGIRKELHEKIFDLNHTESSDPKRVVNGYGIGLYTVKRLVQKMGGTIVLRSSIGEGATFEFSLKK